MINNTEAKSNRNGIGALIKVIIFLIVLFCLLFYLNRVFDMKSTIESEPFSGFYTEKAGTLDGVYLGSSSVYRFWMPTRAFEEHGMCIYNMGTPAQSIALEKYIIIETLKTQPQMKVIIIDLRNLVRYQINSNEGYLRMVTDAMKMSKNRIDAIHAGVAFYEELGSDMDCNVKNYYIPFAKYHNRWEDDLTLEDLKATRDIPEYKGFVTNYEYDVKKLSVPNGYAGVQPMDDTRTATFEELLQFCQTLDQEVIFVSSPFYGNQKRYEHLNAALKMCRDAGFITWDFNSEPLKSELAIDWSCDFHDKSHTNVRGAVKYTKFISNMINETIKIEDHRGDSTYESWVEAAEKLNREIKSYE